MIRLIRDFGKKVLTLSGKISPRFNAKLLFLMRTHKWPNLKNPKTFNEKTTWLKLNKYNNDDLASKCADKYVVREYVESKGCGEILNELYGVYDNFDEINFDKLPDKFVIKCTHGCAYNIIVKDKSNFDIDAARKKIKHWQKEKYGYATAELHYTKIKPRIIVEKYLCDKDEKMPVDYKFYCMNGEVKCILVCSERDKKLKLSYYNVNWVRFKYERDKWSSAKDIKKPANLKKMIEYAEKLSGGFPFVRVDLYSDGGRIIFGELTFTPACGCAPYYTKEADKDLGRMFNLGNKICIIGHFGGKREFYDGQTIKTKEIESFLSKEGYTISRVDTYHAKKRLLRLLLNIRKAVAHNDVVILVVSSRGYRMLLPFLVKLNERYKRKMFDFVIGGVRYKVFDKRPKYKNMAKKFTRIYIETERMKLEYRKRGIENVKVIPNFKNLKKEPVKKSFVKNDELRACIFSRVIKEKGISDAIKAIKIANHGSNRQYYLDIYGDVDIAYKDEFYRMIDYNKMVLYKGAVSYNNAPTIITKYDVLLLPTYWSGEGFPGTLVDAFFAAIPIIATDWNDNFEILKDGENAIKVGTKSPKEIAAALKKIANNEEKLTFMSFANSKKANAYLPNIAMAPFLEDLEEEDG